MSIDYKKTLNLPVTSFPMKANLTQREPEMLRSWDDMDVYAAMIGTGNDKGQYILHDGPPYANGHLHMGHALNKILKDFILKSKNMQGFKAEYVPGWDCHGLPIELQVEHSLGDKKKDLPAHVVRKRCRDWANKFIDIQRKEFKRLGIFGTWDDPYLSMAPAYEAATARELAVFYENGSVMRSKKPIHWCVSCRTALAEAEVEYEDHTSPSIYVRFPLSDSKIREIFPEADPSRTYVIIWTTTPWTIPDNLAVAAHPDFDYVLAEVDGAFYLLAEGLLEANAKVYGWSDYKIVGKVTGNVLEGLRARHPFYDRESPLVLGQHVTLEAGTGFVHTAPGHGREDYDMGIKYGLDIYSPMDDEGRFYETVPFFAGLNAWEANPVVVEKLREVGNLMGYAQISHSYPHCWRCKKPVIFRATTQWFIQMEANGLRQKALNAIKNDVEWIPAWGEARIYSMIENRPDWCISRQRTWGVPIVALLCETCNEAWHDAAWAKDVAARFAKHPTGCDYWFEADLSEIVPQGLKCPACGGTHWKKETDILDVWFDSGTSFAAVCEQRPECGYPANMYLEGSDQHRGWFHSSLLASIGTRGIAPYKEVLTHGYVVDGQGRKMSKSLGNGMAPEEIIAKYGAEILRMWVASADYREDIRISEEILSRQVDAYRRLRNTCRYILGNIGDFAPEDAVAEKDMDPLDRFALDLVSRAHDRVQEAYETYEFHKVFHTLHNLCATDLSAFYLDILKDRLYASAPKSLARRSAQTVLWRTLLLLLRAMAPVLSFTAEEVFRFLPDALKPAVPTVFALQQSHAPGYSMPEAERAAWDTLLAVRGEVSRSLEPLRKEGVIGHGLDSRVTLYADEALAKTLEGLGTDLRSVFIVSQFAIQPLADAPANAVVAVEVPGLSIGVEKALGEKCERCWIYSEDLNVDVAFPCTCRRCADVLQELKV